MGHAEVHLWPLFQLDDVISRIINAIELGEKPTVAVDVTCNHICQLMSCLHSAVKLCRYFSHVNSCLSP